MHRRRRWRDIDARHDIGLVNFFHAVVMDWEQSWHPASHGCCRIGKRDVQVLHGFIESLNLSHDCADMVTRGGETPVVHLMLVGKLIVLEG